MLRKTDIMLAILGVLLVSGAAFAEDCPVKHPSLTALDHASMVSAVTASFKGIYGRLPSGQPGSGADDVGYWVQVSDHFGEFSDGVCRAGWSAYWELKLGGADSVSPSLGDQPARFKPTVEPPTPPVPPPAPPAPPPLPSVTVCDLSGLTVAVDNARADIRALQASVEVFQEQVRSHWRDFAKFLAKYGPLITGAILGGRLTKP